jgi:uncharacterized protein
MSAEATAYLDSSALVKLAVREPESAALVDHLRGRAAPVSCALARVEVPRAVRRHGREASKRAAQVLERVALLRLDDALLDAAAHLGGDGLRSLDAIHLAAALAFGQEAVEVVTYDRRMAGAAEGLGLSVVAPQ